MPHLADVQSGGRGVGRRYAILFCRCVVCAAVSGERIVFDGCSVAVGRVLPSVLAPPVVVGAGVWRFPVCVLGLGRAFLQPWLSHRARLCSRLVCRPILCILFWLVAARRVGRARSPTI